MRNLRLIVVIGIVLFGVFVAANNVSVVRSKQTQALSTDDSVSKWEKRIKPVLDHVPGDIKAFGYVAEWDIPGADYNLVDQETEYTLTQYALAPRPVRPGLDQEWIIGNFTKPGFEDWLDQNLSSYEIREIGFGIYLIHRTSQ